MRHRLSGEYTSVGNLKMDWGQGRRKGVLGVLIERLFLLRRYKQVAMFTAMHTVSKGLQLPRLCLRVKRSSLQDFDFNWVF